MEEITDISEHELGPGGGPIGIAAIGGKLAFEVFEHRVSSLNESDFGDFRRTVTECIDHLIENFKTFPKANTSLRRLKDEVNLMPDGDPYVLLKEILQRTAVIKEQI
jgi:hypothetical protein